MARKPRSPRADKAQGGPTPEEDATAARPDTAAAPQDAAESATQETAQEATQEATQEAERPEAERPATEAEAPVPVARSLEQQIQPEEDQAAGPDSETQAQPPETDLTEAPDARDEDARVSEGTRSEPPPPAATPAGQPAQPAAGQRGGPGVLALVGGGVLAAVIGFGAARFVIPEGWPFGPVSQATRALTEKLEQQGARLETLRGDLDTLPGTLAARIEDAAAGAADTAIAALRDDLGGRIDTLAADVAALRDSLARLDGFDARLTDLERRPVADGAASRAAIESFESELAGLRDLLEQERARNRAAEAEIESRAKALRDEAEALARQTARDTARQEITRALASGGGFAGAVDTLAKAGVAIPDALRQHAQGGVPTLESLQQGFAGPARAALGATAGGGIGEIGAFLRAQFGVRSLAPREGDSTDAILSRAEAAVRAGDLGAALAELDTLPPEARAAMADWRADAQARKDVTEAAALVMQ